MMMYEPLSRLQSNPADRWIFRWGFEFASKPSKVGGWHPATRFEDMASAVNKDGLLWAYVEGKHWTYRDQQRIFARVAGQDFINFEHLSIWASVAGKKTAVNHVYGMRIQARNEVITCYDDGSVTHEKRSLGHDFIYPEWTRV